MMQDNWIGLAVPVAYIAVLLGSLATFSSLYRRRKAGMVSNRFSTSSFVSSLLSSAKSAALAPWFPSHLQRNVYLSLLHMEPDTGAEKSIPVPESVIRAALLRRATEDINRIMQIRNAKQACSSLLQRGSVSDDLWQRFLRAEKEMEEEIKDVVNEVRRNYHIITPA